MARLENLEHPVVNNHHSNTSVNKAWGIYANNGKAAEAVRPFNQPMLVGQTLRLDLDNGWINNANENPSGAGEVGFELRSGNSSRVHFSFTGGDANYRLVDIFGARDTGIGFTDGGLHIEFTLSGNNAYTLTVLPNGGTKKTFAGSLLNGGSLDNLRFFNFSAGDFSSRDAFLNSLQIVP